jgi:hypothetical protein
VEKFVHSAYFTLLGHDVDPGGLAYWVNAIDTGTPRSALASALSGSADYRTRVTGGTGLNSFYQFYLGRTSDLNGVGFWVGRMASGMTFEQVRLRFTRTCSEGRTPTIPARPTGWPTSTPPPLPPSSSSARRDARTW